MKTKGGFKANLIEWLDANKDKIEIISILAIEAHKNQYEIWYQEISE